MFDRNYLSRYTVNVIAFTDINKSLKIVVVQILYLHTELVKKHLSYKKFLFRRKRQLYGILYTRIICTKIFAFALLLKSQFSVCFEV